jgi:PAS domain S-box-containing protein
MIFVSSAATNLERLAALQQTGLLEPSAAGTYDLLSQRVRHTLQADAAYLAVVERDHQLLRGSAGLPSNWLTAGGLQLEGSLTAITAAAGATCAIPDLRAHPVSRPGHPLPEAEFGAFAAAPVRLEDGHVIGAFAVVALRPRSWQRPDLAALEEFAAIAARQADLCRALLTRTPRRHETERPDAAVDPFDPPPVFRKIVEHSLAGIYLVQDERFLYVNPRLAELFGYSQDEIIGKKYVADLVAPQDRERVLANIRKRIEGSLDTMYHRFTGLRGDGKEIRVEVLGSRAWIGGRTAVVGTLLDITEREHAEQALRSSEERYRLVARATHSAIRDCDLRSGTIAWDGAAERLRFPSGRVGSTLDWWYSRIHPEDREAVIAGVRRELDGSGEFWSQEYRFRRGDGSYATVLDSCCIVRDSHGEAVRLLGSMIDVTERRHAEEAERFLARASLLLDETFDYEASLPRLARLAVPVLADCCLIDVARGDGTTVRLAVGHVDPSEEERWSAYDHAELRARLEHDATLLDVEQPILIPQVLPGGHGRDLRFADIGSIIASPLRAHSQMFGLLTLVRLDSSRRSYGPEDLLIAEDLGRRIALAIEQALLYERAQDAVQTRDELLGIVSHDLRNPLHTIRLGTSMLLDTLDDRRTANQQSLQLIERAAEQMNRIIEDLLDVSVLETGNFSLECAPHDAAAVVAEARALLEPLAGQRSLTIDCSVEDDLPSLNIDFQQLLRVFSNLVGNAIKFTPEGGQIRIIAHRHGDEVRFAVADTGPGIPDDQLAHIFDRYWQGRQGDRRGAGLGLAIAKAIVEAHGGRIWVENPASGGATFSFTIPSGATSSTPRG